MGGWGLRCLSESCVRTDAAATFGLFFSRVFVLFSFFLFSLSPRAFPPPHGARTVTKRKQTHFYAAAPARFYNALCSVSV